MLLPVFSQNFFKWELLDKSLLDKFIQLFKISFYSCDEQNKQTIWHMQKRFPFVLFYLTNLFQVIFGFIWMEYVYEYEGWMNK